MYEITITEITDRHFTKRAWVQVGTSEEAREGRFYARDANEPKTRISPVYGEGPEELRVDTVKTVRLSQVVEKLDLPAVIKAINGL